jgi:hypothetical protein
MRHIEINLPYGLPSKQAAGLVRELHAPALAVLLSHARSSLAQPASEPASEAFARALPHELWLGRQFGITNAPDRANTSLPLAAALMQSLGLSAGEGFWFILNPAHIHFAQDKLALADQRLCALSEAESRVLFDAARPSFEQEGKLLEYGNAATWFVRADDWNGLQTASPDAACGHNLEFWLPEGPGEKAWRRLHNEIQMLWHAHPVNRDRESSGLLPANALWLWGGAKGKMAGWPDAFSGKYTDSFKLSGWMQAFARYVPRNVADCTADELMAMRPQHGLLVLDGLIGPALASDWETWLAVYRELEQNWFAPLLRALHEKSTDRLTLTIGNDEKMLAFTTSRLSLRKFWVKPSLTKLLP